MELVDDESHSQVQGYGANQALPKEIYTAALNDGLKPETCLRLIRLTCDLTSAEAYDIAEAVDADILPLYYELRDRLLSPEDATQAIKKNNYAEGHVIRILRKVYGLSLEEAKVLITE